MLYRHRARIEGGSERQAVLILRSFAGITMPVKTNGGRKARRAIVRPVIMGELPTRLIIPMLIEEIKFNRIPSRKIRERGEEGERRGEETEEGPRAPERRITPRVIILSRSRDRRSGSPLAATVDIGLLRNNCRR